MAFKDLLKKGAGLLKGAAGSGMMGPVAKGISGLFKKGGRIKKGGGKRDMFTQQYD